MQAGTWHTYTAKWHIQTAKRRIQTAKSCRRRTIITQQRGQRARAVTKKNIVRCAGRYDFFPETHTRSKTITRRLDGGRAVGGHCCSCCCRAAAAAVVAVWWAHTLSFFRFKGKQITNSLNLKINYFVLKIE